MDMVGPDSYGPYYVIFGVLGVCFSIAYKIGAGL